MCTTQSLSGVELNLMNFLMNGREFPAIAKEYILANKLSFSELPKMNKSQKLNLEVLERAVSLWLN